jgi:uncharacterized protein (TIGR02231 family)
MNERKNALQPRRMYIAVSLALAGACMSGSVYAQDASKITAVTLYPGSATVERTAKVTPGMTRLEIAGLPANFDPQTVRVEADPGVRIGEVSTQDASRVSASNARESQIEDRIQALKDQQALLDAEAKSAEMVQEFLSRLGAPAGEKPAPLPDAKVLATVVDLIRHGGGESLARVQRVQVQKREIGKQIAALERDLARLRSGARDTRTILIGVYTEHGGSARVSYQVNGAGWRPTYRANLDSVGAKLQLERQGVVSQTTGEDWSGVKLKLSTGQPRVSPRGPDPQPWLVSFAQLAQAMGAVANMQDAPRQSLAEARREKDKPVGSPAPAPIEAQTTFGTEFEVPGQVSLPSDGRKVTVSLAKLQLPVKLSLRVVPRLDPTAIVTAEAKRPEGVWLAGEMQLQRDGNYVGSTNWIPQSSDAFVLPFGRDELVRVKVARVKDRNGSAGVLARKNEREVTDVVTLASFHKTPLELLVLEPSPVATADQINVQASFEPQPQIENWEQRQGVVGWQRSIAPNETVKITMNYTIGYPKDGAVVGLP